MALFSFTTDYQVYMEFTAGKPAGGVEPPLPRVQTRANTKFAGKNERGFRIQPSPDPCTNGTYQAPITTGYGFRTSTRCP